MTQTRDFLLAIYQTIAHGIITIDEDSVILGANPRVEEVWGYTPDELVGQSVTMLMPTRYRDRHKAGLKRCAQTRKGDAIDALLEVEGVKKDGTVFPLEIRIEETPLADRLLFTAAVRDNTAGNRVIQAARQNQKKLRQQAGDLRRERDALARALDNVAKLTKDGAACAEILSALESARQTGG